MTANDSKSYLAYLTKLVDQYNNTFHHSINQKPINADHSALTRKKKKKEINLKAVKFKINHRVRIAKYKNIFSEDYTKKSLRQYLLLILF